MTKIKEYFENNRENLAMLAVVFVLSAAFVFSALFVFAETVADPAVIGEKRAQLEAELAQLESQMNFLEDQIGGYQKEGASLERDIAILDAEIKRAQLGIKARTLTMNKLQEQITDKTRVIGELGDQYEREKASLAEMMRQLNELSDISEVELILKYENLSDFFGQVDAIDQLQSGIQNSFDEIKATKKQTETERADLEDRKQEESDLLTIQQLEKRGIEEKERAKNQLLKDTRGKEKEYQKILTARQQDAAKIRSQLFLLQGSAAIPFEKALEYANRAYEKTGVRPAFILGILTQESNLGENTGQCFVKNLATGAGVGKNTGRFFPTVMKSPRDTVIFASITASLGIDPLNTVVSCPPSYGYGGAMGPAQFIPSTWTLYEKKIADLTGHNPPNPWYPEDAFMASALLLRDGGAAGGVYANERKAALKYFAGSNWQKKAYAFYGNDVMALATKYQEQIDILSGKR